MTAGVTSKQRATASDSDADIDQFLVEHHDDVAAKLAAGRDQILRGEIAPLEPLDALLRDARLGR